jgi:hypothetical protein
MDTMTKVQTISKTKTMTNFDILLKNKGHDLKYFSVFSSDIDKTRLENHSKNTNRT